MSTPKPLRRDFAEAGAFPAKVEVVLSNGYRYRSAATDEEAGKIIRQLSDFALADELAQYERGKW